MPAPDSPDPSSTAEVAPPPLPQKVRLFQIAWVSGLVIGAAQLIFSIVALVGFSSTRAFDDCCPETRTGPPPFLLYIAAAAAAVQAFSAYRIRQGSASARIIFTLATAMLMFFVMTLGGILFAAINAVPLLLLVLSISTKPSRPNETTAAGTINRMTSEAPQSRAEDLY